MDIKAKITISSNFGTTIVDTANPPAPNPLTDWLMRLIQPRVLVQGTATIPGIISQDASTEWAPYGVPTQNYTPVVVVVVILIIVGLVILCKKPS